MLQLCRLHNSPLALNVARRELMGGLRGGLSMDVAVAATAPKEAAPDKLMPLADSRASPIKRDQE